MDTVAENEECRTRMNCMLRERKAVFVLTEEDNNNNNNVPGNLLKLSFSVDKLREANKIFFTGEEEKVEETTSLNVMRRGTVKRSFGEWRGCFLPDLLSQICCIVFLSHSSSCMLNHYVTNAMKSVFRGPPVHVSQRTSGDKFDIWTYEEGMSRIRSVFNQSYSFHNEKVHFLMKGFETSVLTMGMTVVHCEMRMNLSMTKEEVKALDNFIVPPDHIRNFRRFFLGIDFGFLYFLIYEILRDRCTAKSENIVGISSQ